MTLNDAIEITTDFMVCIKSKTLLPEGTENMFHEALEKLVDHCKIKENEA